MPTKTYRFEIRTSGNGIGGKYTKSVISTTLPRAWKEVVKQLSAADLLDIVTEIKRI